MQDMEVSMTNIIPGNQRSHPMEDKITNFCKGVYQCKKAMETEGVSQNHIKSIR